MHTFCPFCGGVNIETLGSIHGEPLANCRCRTCGATGPQSATITGAMESWNRRSPGPAPRDPIDHEVKCWPHWFAAVRSGDKPFEIRKNDRDYRDGDTMTLREYEPALSVYTDQKVSVGILRVWHGLPHLEPGYVLIELKLPPRIPEQLA